MKETGETAEAISQSMVREVESQEPKRAMAKKKIDEAEYTGNRHAKRKR